MLQCNTDDRYLPGAVSSANCKSVFSQLKYYEQCCHSMTLFSKMVNSR